MPVSPENLSVHVELGPRSYEIVIGSGTLASIAEPLILWLEKLPAAARKSRKAFIVTDRNIEATHAKTVCDSLSMEGWTCHVLALDAGERSKSLASLNRMYDWLVEHKADRFSVLIAVGGGVIGDAAGFAAASYARGIPFVQVPTTLLAQVDSSVGGKVAVNHDQAKNLIGAFYQPLGVLIDTATLISLPDREYRCGLAEVVKYGVILDEKFFEELEAEVDALNARKADVLRQVIARCCRLKADVVEKDEQELTGLRAVLNYGHTFAHAFEALCGYGELLHGEAVAIGMLYASRLAERRKLIRADVTERQAKLWTALHLPTRLPGAMKFRTDDVLDRMRLDKKVVAGNLRFVLPTRIGHVDTYGDVPESDVRAVLDAEA